MRPRGRQALFFAGLLIFLLFSLFTLAALRSLPREVRLLPGETGRLRVFFPLRLDAGQRGRSFLAGRKTSGSELTVRSPVTGVFAVELKLLGALSLGRIPIKIVAPKKVMVGGQAIGVVLSPEGVLVVGHRPLRGIDSRFRYPAREAGLEVGDVILRADGETILDPDDLVRAVTRAAAEDRALQLTIQRAGRTLYKTIKPVLCRGEAGDEETPRAMLGLLVEDPAAGVGTLTFYDPRNMVFAALGHRINEVGGRRRFWLEGGKIVAARIAGITQGRRGEPGEKIGTFRGPEDVLGTIERNSRFGLFGRLHLALPQGREVPVALAHQVRPGPATILTVLHGTEVEEFTVEIIRVYHQTQPRDRGLVLEVTDERLLAATGGIVQGMSGSPILQNGRLVGAVTHVFVNDPTRGYGVLAEWMLREMEAVFPSPDAREELPAA
ncbi:MAG: SpoIVB peptidase [Firmicutes bacterium]|nr:SpoIVB peptidase [Bacillota bacterium]